MNPVINIDISWLRFYPRELLEAVKNTAREFELQVYVVGGAVRDGLLLRAETRDLDLSVVKGGVNFARKLALALGGTFVPLDEKEGIARVVWQGYDIDLADFKDGVESIEEDLGKRDFTVNAMAVKFPSEPLQTLSSCLIDPAGGSGDLEKGIIRAVSKRTFRDDPLRLLRAYRFQATLGFSLAEATEREIEENVHLVDEVAAERISYELDLIMASNRSCRIFTSIGKAGFLRHILPEMEKGAGMEQPAGHHLDVREHNLAALCAMEEVLRDPGKYFREEGVLRKYLQQRGIALILKWAAFFHDLGKPDTMAVRGDKITFYNHDQCGADLVTKIGIRLRWSKDRTGRISRLVKHHMRPFHLSNVRRKEGVTTRACLRLVKTAADDLPGLFLLALADSLASQGSGRPVNMEQEISELFSEVCSIVDREVTPGLASPRLISGRDLIEQGLTPGPVFKDILQEAEEAQVAGEISDREEALAWLQNHIGQYYPELVR
ncbi:MAG: CCA tRNA nucleotidyltransferase [Desulfurivibrionaceae bacterium]